MPNSTKYNFNGKRNLGKRNLAFEIINKYLKENSNKTYQELKIIFNLKASNNQEVIRNEDDYKKWLDTNDNPQRYKYYGSYNNEKIYISAQWSITSIQPLIELAKNSFSYKIEIANENETIVDNFKIIQIKNILIYGAPGVGKTHNYKRLISMIEEDKESQHEIFKTISDNEITIDEYDTTFQTIKNEKRIEFVTFHQSYSYEDFIEGFRPDEDTKSIIRKDGVFKRISEKARENLENSKQDIEEIKNLLEFRELFEEFKDLIRDEIDTNNKYIINETAYIVNVEDDAFRYTGESWGNTQRMKFSDIELLYNLNITERKDIRKVENISGLAKQHSTYFSYLVKKFSEFRKNKHVSISALKKEEQKKFYIVIDEINRGNISKIFGELITLIEEDKRDTYEVTLPYSKEKFKIPSNLYIIATMNSTDKSIVTIDIALRRRFTFLKMKPNPILVKDDNARQLMRELNQYIRKSSLGEDYQLGHSYFMKIEDEEDLTFIKEYKIKPLLEEYFYSDEMSVNDIIELAKKEYTNKEETDINE